MFHAPGLESWAGDNEDQDAKSRNGRKDEWNGTYSLQRHEEKSDEETGQANGFHHGDANDMRRR